MYPKRVPLSPRQSPVEKGVSFSHEIQHNTFTTVLSGIK